MSIQQTSTLAGGLFDEGEVKMWLIAIFVAIAGLMAMMAPIFLLWCLSKAPQRTLFRGKHVLITGGSQGIGLELAKKCAALGSDVTILARNIGQLNIAKLAIEENKKFPDSQRAQTAQCDLTAGYDAVEEAIRKAEKTFGPVNILINCAGFAKCKYFEDTTLSEFKMLMDVNYYGSLHASKAVLDNMKRDKAGTIVFISSQGGQVGFIGMSAYAPTKYAVKGLAESLHNELLPFNINVAVCYPPDTDTPGYKAETEDKVVECQEISQTAGLLQPDYVAKQIISGLQRGSFSLSFGADGMLLEAVTAGLTPFPGFFKSFVQVYLIGIFRVVGMCYATYFQHIVMKHKKSRYLYKEH